MRKNIFYYVLGGILAQASVFLLWLLLPAFLSPDQIGSYNYLMYYVDVFSATVILGGDAVLVRYYYSRFEHTEVWGAVFYVSLLSNVALCILLLLNAKFAWYPLPLTSSWMILILPLIIFVNAIANLVLVHYSALKEAVKYTRIQFLKIFTFSGLSLIFCMMHLGVLGIIIALLCSCVVIIALYLPKRSFSIFVKIPSKKLMRETLSYGVPLMLYSIVGVLSLYASRLYLQQYLGMATMGIFGFFLTITLQINGFWSSFNKAWAPEIYSKTDIQQTKAVIHKMVYTVVSLYLIILALGAWIGDLIVFNIILKPVYQSSVNIFLVLLLFPAVTSIYTIFYPLFYFNNKTTLILVISVVSAASNLLIMNYAVSHFGTNGAAAGTILSSVLNLLFYFIAFHRIVSVNTTMFWWLMFLLIVFSASIFSLIKGYPHFVFEMLMLVGGIFTFFIGGVQYHMQMAWASITQKLAGKRQ